MAVLKTNQIDASLQKKGFIKEKNRDHIYYFLYLNGKKTSIRTKTSHSAKEINDTLIKIMSQQVKLTREQFMDLINCPLSKEAYEEILIESGCVSL